LRGGVHISGRPCRPGLVDIEFEMRYAVLFPLTMIRLRLIDADRINANDLKPAGQSRLANPYSF